VTAPRPPAGPLRALDWFNFLVANVQTGFGPFVAVHLTAQAWTQGEIGIALSIGTIASIASQVPAGALVDALARKRLAAFAACLAIAVCALLIGLWPVPLSVWIAKLLHGAASSILTPAIAAISLALVGHAALGARLGRNARYAAIGSGLAAGAMGLVGTYVSESAVFLLTAALMAPALLVLLRLPAIARPPPPPPGTPAPAPGEGRREILALLSGRHLPLFALAALLFHLANAAQLPLMAGEATMRDGSQANLVIAASILLPQAILALLAPSIGTAADRWGRRPVLAACFLAVPLRAALLSVTDGSLALILIQALDGISAAGFGVLVPLVTADITRGTNRFTLCLGVIGLASAAGATLSTAIAGLIADAAGIPAALLVLAGFGVAATLTAGLALPETRP
jgi:MFS family permease